MIHKKINPYNEEGFLKKYAIGIIVAVILVIIVCMNSSGTERLVFAFFAAVIGIITNAIIKGIITRKFMRTILSVGLIIIISGFSLFTLEVTVGIDEIHDYFAPEYSLDFQLYNSFTIEGTVVGDEMKMERSTLFAQPRRPTPMDLQYILKENGLEFLTDALTDTADNEDSLVILTFGRELKEVKYKYMGYYGDGVTARGEISFCEEYEDSIMYVYYTKIHDLHFMNCYCQPDLI